MALLLMAALAPTALAAVVAPVSYSGFTYAPCSKTEEMQHFTVEAPTGTGRIIDGETGRCLSLQGCSADRAFNGDSSMLYGNVVLDTCSDTCDGKSAQWKATPQPGTPQALTFRNQASLSKCWLLNAVGGTKGGVKADEMMVVWGFDATDCPPASGANNEYEATKDGQIRIVNSNRVGDLCTDPTKCCLQALPCSLAVSPAFPCVHAHTPREMWGVGPMRHTQRNICIVWHVGAGGLGRSLLAGRADIARRLLGRRRGLLDQGRPLRPIRAGYTPAIQGGKGACVLFY
jgi:hypothetical protein